MPRQTTATDLPLHAALSVVFKDLLQVRREENVLILTDTKQDFDLVREMMTVLESSVEEPQMVVMRPRRFPGEEPSGSVLKAMEAADAIFFAGTASITYSQAVAAARASGARVLIAVGITQEILNRAVAVNYPVLRSRAEQARKIFQESTSVELTCPLGSHLTARLKNRPGFIVDGFADKPGMINWIPAGSAHVAPEEGTAEGVVFIDGSLVPLGILQEPIKLVVRDGFIIDISGGREALEYKAFLEGFGDRNVFNLGEIAVGVNPQAQLTGLPIEDERIQGGVVIGIGQNVLHGGVVEAPTHTDAISTAMTLKMDNQIIIDNGRLLI